MCALREKKVLGWSSFFYVKKGMNNREMTCQHLESTFHPLLMLDTYG